MKILYGVVGEGMGHAMRSSVVLGHLVARGHDVQIMASGRAVAFLSKRFAGVKGIHGFHMIYEDNRVLPMKTLWSNVTRGAAGLPGNVAAYFDLIRGFRPEAVISDFESWTYLYGTMHRLPILSIDNMQVINRCRLPPGITQGHEAELKLTRAFIKSKLPFCDDYFITTFFRPEIRKRRTRLFPPILRPEILAAKKAERRRGEHLLAYTTGEGNEKLAAVLAATGLECRIFGMRRDIKAEVVEGSLRHRPFSEKGFIEDLSTALGVIAGGGFTLMGEAVYLGVPMLAVPVARQFEQLVNARYLEREGYGRCAESLESPEVVRGFVEEIPAYRKALERHEQDGNAEILQAVDEWLVGPA